MNSTQHPIRWVKYCFYLLLLTAFALHGNAQDFTLDFEDFDGLLATNDTLDSLGISFGTPTVELDVSNINGAISPVTVFQRDGAFSGERVAENCSSPIGCEFPNGTVLIEFAEIQENVSFWLNGTFLSDRQILVYTYDTEGELSLQTTLDRLDIWQEVVLSDVKGIIIDRDTAGFNLGFAYWIDDITFTPLGSNEEPFLDCGAQDGLEERLQNDSIYRQSVESLEQLTQEYIRDIALISPYDFGSEVITIPVVVHVVYNNDSENVSDAQIQTQIASLNEIFRRNNVDISTVPTPFAPFTSDLRIEFALAQRDPDCNPTNGITRTSTSVIEFTKDQNAPTPTTRNPVKFDSSGGKDGWPSNEYLNLWVCDIAGSTLGYASFPSDLAARPTEDGVVMDYTAFGTIGTANPPFNLGRVAAHEVGHWLNLFHIWGNNQTPICTDSDEVDDTPNQFGPNTACPSFPSISCSNGPNGDMFMNHMDYTLDNCRTMFTLGQHVRAAATLFGVRASIIGSDALVPPPPAPAPDLWSQDTPDDIGLEPNPSPNRMYHSADIWVRRTNDGFTNQEHQNPLYRASGEPNYVYVRIRNRGCEGPQSGTVRTYWAKASSGLSWPSPWDASVSSPALMGAPLGDAPVTVNAGEFEILQFPWVVPNPDDYASFGADRAHFCLLSRIETGGGMTFPETSNLPMNVRNNNNIVWKNISISTEDAGGFSSWLVVGNYSLDDMETRLRFDLPAGELLSIFDWGQVRVDLGELFEVWENGGGVGENIDILDDGTIQLLGPGAELGNMGLAQEEFFTIKVNFQPSSDSSITNVFKLNMDQIDVNAEELIGGQQFVFKTLANGIILPGSGNSNPPVFVDCPDSIAQECIFPITASVDMSNVLAPDNLLGNFTGVLNWDPSEITYVGPSEILSGFTGFINVDETNGQITFNGASVAGLGNNVPIFEAYFRATGSPGTIVMPDLQLRTLVSAGTFQDLLPEATIFNCDFFITPSLILGDVDGDGSITSTDGALILAFSVGNPIPATATNSINQGVGDVDSDGDTDPTDALIILTFDVGLPVDFPIGEPTLCPDSTVNIEERKANVGADDPVVPIQIYYSSLEADETLFPITVDMSNTNERLGSFLMEVSWDTTLWEYIEFSGGESPGFEHPVINFQGIEGGFLKFANAHVEGLDGMVNIGNLRLSKKNQPTTDSLGLKVSVLNLAGALTFNNFIAEISIQQEDVVTDNKHLLDVGALEMNILPNPFEDKATIRIQSDVRQLVDLVIYNAQGQKIKQLLKAKDIVGEHNFSWDGTTESGNEVSAGVYFFMLRSQRKQISKILIHQ